MSGAGMKPIRVCLLLIALSGCSSVAVPVVKEAQKCSPEANLLAACDEPGAVEPGITFGRMIEISSRDRESLRQCALRQKSLVDAITACNNAIDAYNGEIREFNARNAAKQ